jgi:hypothetical protein
MGTEAEFVAGAIAARAIEETKVALDLAYKITIFNGAAIALSVTFSVGLMGHEQQMTPHGLHSGVLIYIGWFALLLSTGIVAASIFMLFKSLSSAFEASFSLGTALQNVEKTEHVIRNPAHVTRIESAKGDLRDSYNLQSNAKVACLASMCVTLIGLVLLVVYAGANLPFEK